MTALTRAEVSEAVLAVLAASTLPVGDGRVPAPQPDRTRAYLICYEMPSAFRDLDATGLQDGATFEYQLTAVGALRDQATRALDKARGVLTAAALQAVLSGVNVAVCESAGPGAALAVRGARGDLFNAAETYTVVVYRAS